MAKVLHPGRESIDGEMSDELLALWSPPPEGLPPGPAVRRRRSWRWGALVVAASLVAGGVAGGVAGWLTESGTGTEAAATQTTTATIPPGEGTVPPIPEIVAAIEQSVVAIRATSQNTFGPFGRTVTEETAGTGFVPRPDGMIATNAHVVSSADEIVVTLLDRSTLPATVVGSDTSADLALLHVEATDVVAVTLGSAAMRVGDLVIAVGNALALEGGPTASLGILSALDRSVTTTDGDVYEHLMQTDAAVNAGDSGGPLVNGKGEVIGINTAAASAQDAENIGFAIAIDNAAPVLTALAAAAG